MEHYASEHMMDAVFDAVKDYIERNGYPPSRRDVAQQLGVSAAAVQSALTRLQQVGRLRIHPSISRGIALVDSTAP